MSLCIQFNILFLTFRDLYNLTFDGLSLPIWTSSPAQLSLTVPAGGSLLQGDSVKATAVLSVSPKLMEKLPRGVMSNKFSGCILQTV